MESELFGHERGAFTGAQSARKGLLEMAHDGTLFLDEIGDLSLKYQARLLEFLHSGKIQRLGGLQVLRLNVRILAATHRNLEELVRVGKFREDLFHRLRVIQIELPSLQSCSEDFNDIFHEILTESSKKAGKRILKVSPDLARRLEAHCWNGNLRELRHVIEATVALSEGEELTLGDLPPWVEIAGADKSLNSNGSSTSSVALHAVMRTLLKTHPNYQEARLAFDRQLFEAALQKNYYRVTRTARFLGLPKTTLLRKLKKCGINTSMFLKSELNPDEPEHA
jgi:DNA-binding NtrC family response regulator